MVRQETRLANVPFGRAFPRVVSLALQKALPAGPSGARLGGYLTDHCVEPSDTLCLRFRNGRPLLQHDVLLESVLFRSSA